MVTASSAESEPQVPESPPAGWWRWRWLYRFVSKSSFRQLVYVRTLCKPVALQRVLLPQRTGSCEFDPQIDYANERRPFDTWLEQPHRTASRRITFNQTQWMEISLKHCWYANEGISLKNLNHFSQTWRNSGSIPNSEFRPPSGAAACDSVRFMPPGSGWLVNNPQRKESVNSALPVAPQSTCAPFPAFNKKIIWRFVWKFMQMNNIWTEKLKSLWRNWWLVERTGWTIRGRFTKTTDGFREIFYWILALIDLDSKDLG